MYFYSENVGGGLTPPLPRTAPPSALWRCDLAEMAGLPQDFWLAINFKGQKNLTVCFYCGSVIMFLQRLLAVCFSLEIQ